MKKKWPIILAFFAAMGAVMEYPVAALIILSVAFIIFLLYLYLKKRKEEAEAEAKRKVEAEKEAARKASEEARRAEAAAREQAFQKRLEDAKQERLTKTKRFNDEIAAIPLVDVAVSAPAPRHYMKDMPEYSFSNVTQKTKLSSIFPLVVLDTETTGIYPSKSEIIEVSAIKFDVGMKPIAAFTTLCKPKHLIPPEATAVNHITDDMVEDCPSFRQIAPALSDFIKGCNVVGHNLEFDLAFTYMHGAELPFGKRFYDTLEIAQHTHKRADIGNHKLTTLCAYYGIVRDDAHRSLSDCYATAKIFNYLVFDKTSRQLDKEGISVSESDT